MAKKEPLRETLMLKPSTLWTRVIQRTEHALRCGAMQSIPTKSEFIEQNGIHFLVRILSNQAHKEEEKKQEKESTAFGDQVSPFLPYDKDLFVADVSDTHVCLLNKYNVMAHHLLIVTRSFEDQQSLLTLRDFEAMWACMAEFAGLAFYNAGKTAGASQRHKHLQIVPLPLVPSGPRLPIEPIIESASFKNSVGILPGLPFLHAAVRMDPGWMNSPLEATVATLECYLGMLRAVGMRDGIMTSGDTLKSGAYNLLVTQQWMLLVPRSQECFESISVNSLGFAGALLVRNEQQMKVLKDHGPMTILRHVAVPLDVK